jgi:GH15 family glucan-1,4-alpha-glucosidase
MDSLLRKSISIILENQAPGGAYVASPNFPAYHYCWFRDGAFIAYAMDRMGEYESARLFHTWAAARINERGQVVNQAILKFKSHQPLTHADYLFTRFKLNGSEGLEEDWPNFQLDGFGTWLWSLNEHIRLSKQTLTGDLLNAAGLAADYLEALWTSPCFDCWEEFPEQVHPYTLAAIFGGLQAHTALSGRDHSETLAAIRALIVEKWVFNGHFVKFSGKPEVDASLIGLCTPYRVFEPDHPLMAATIEQIEAALTRAGGVHRYRSDTYYGGGEWILLSAWLGWYFAEIGEESSLSKARKQLEWVESQFQEEGLPEQVPANLNDPAYFPVWVERWGRIALPLLWSHASYIILWSASAAIQIEASSPGIRSQPPPD